MLDDLYRDAIPDRMEITKFEWEVILLPRRERRGDQGRAGTDGEGMAMTSNWPDRPTSAELELEKLRDQLVLLRKELTFTRVAAFGVLGVLVLSLLVASRLVVGSALSVVLLVVVFLGCRWGIGDLQASLGQSIGVTLALAVIMGLLLWWWIP